MNDARRESRGCIEVNEETLGYDVIAAVGPGGDFLRTKHTKAHVRALQWKPTMFNRVTRAHWEAAGSLDLTAKARRKALDILANHTPEPFPADVKKTMDSLVDAFVAAGK